MKRATVKILRARCPETRRMLYCMEGGLGRTEWQDVERFERFLLSVVVRYPMIILTETMSFGPDHERPWGAVAFNHDMSYQHRSSSMHELMEWHWQHWWDDAILVPLEELVNRCVGCPACGASDTAPQPPTYTAPTADPTRALSGPFQPPAAPQASHPTAPPPEGGPRGISGAFPGALHRP